MPNALTAFFTPKPVLLGHLRQVKISGVEVAHFRQRFNLRCCYSQTNMATSLA